MTRRFSFYEFFAGGGMARLGLGDKWQCRFANDMDPLKGAVYEENFGDDHFDNNDIWDVSVEDLAESVDLAWASFPCQDLSVAGNGLGIGNGEIDNATRSGALWPFLNILRQLKAKNAQPAVIVLENVVGLLSINGGKDFSLIMSQLMLLGYKAGAVVLDARHFVPQSRSRVFVIAVRDDVSIPRTLTRTDGSTFGHTPTLMRVYDAMDEAIKANWIWWRMTAPPLLPENTLMEALVLEDALWDRQEEIDRLLSMMAPSHVERLEAAKKSGKPQIGSLYLRMRKEHGKNVQRTEIAFGPVLGCLRTPKGGASRPRIIYVVGDQVRTRLVTPREAARLMGLDESYILPEAYSRAFKVLGDGVVVPLVRFLANSVLEPLAKASSRKRKPTSRKKTAVKNVAFAFRLENAPSQSPVAHKTTLPIS